jgi:hypothetical protein
LGTAEVGDLGSVVMNMRMSSNGFRNLIVKLLKEYNFKINEFKVYLRADYSEMEPSEREKELQLIERCQSPSLNF